MNHDLVTIDVKL